MSQMVDVDTSSTKQARAYRKGRPMSNSERLQAFKARRKETHREIKVLVPQEIKQLLQMMCEEEGISQAEMISRLIEKADFDLGS